MKILSIVICTYNRANLLERLLESLSNQTDVDQIDFEVLVIDNNSTDETRAVVNRFAKSNNNFHYFFEGKQGLSHARNRGYIEAKGEYVAYLDDEILLPTNWLLNSLKIIRNFQPIIFGGPYHAYYDTDKPKWFKDEYASYPYRKTGTMDDGFISGGNMIFRRDILISIGGFNPDLGMTGTKLAYAEETEVQDRIRKIFPNKLIYYSNDILVYHLVRKEKFLLVYQIKRSFANGKSAVHWEVKENTSQVILFALLFRQIIKLFFDFLFKLPFRNYKEFPYIENYIFERIATHFTTIGRFAEEMKSHWQMKERK